MTNETLADIVAEMRFHGQQGVDAEKNKPDYGILTVEGKIVINYADRLMAAHQREVAELKSHADSEERWANRYFEAAFKSAATAKRLRAALEAVLAAYKSGAIHTCAEHYRDEWDDELCDLKAKVEAALFVHIDVPKRIHDGEDVHTETANDIHNAAALREALETMVNCIDWLCEGDNTGRISKQFSPLLSQARAALAAPARNCDRFATVSDDNVSLLADEVREHARRLSGGEYYIIPEQVVRYLLATAEGGAEC